MREPIAPLWKGNGPLHFHPHIQVSLSSLWRILNLSQLHTFFCKVFICFFPVPKNNVFMPSSFCQSPTGNSDSEPGELPLITEAAPCPEINEWLSLFLRIVQGWNDSSLLYLVDLFHAVCSCGSLSFVFTWVTSCWYNWSKSDENVHRKRDQLKI